MTETPPPNLNSLARPSGCFAMVAMDQRESLRQMFTAANGEPATDQEMTAFKLSVAREVAPYASGFLIDTEYGFDQVASSAFLPGSCGLIVAADRLQQDPHGPVEDTDFDAEIDLHQAREAGAVAAKLLVIWRDDRERARRVRMSTEFVNRCADAGLISVLEGVARSASPGSGATGDPGHADETSPIERAARELAAVGPDLYKAQVPMAGKGGFERLTEKCVDLDALIPMPWVVLSQGVDREDFATAVQAACRAGASGMLAGRAIWSDLVGSATDLDQLPFLLRERSVSRLQELREIVDANGRPWNEVR